MSVGAGVIYPILRQTGSATHTLPHTPGDPRPEDIWKCLTYFYFLSGSVYVSYVIKRSMPSHQICGSICGILPVGADVTSGMVVGIMSNIFVEIIFSREGYFGGIKIMKLAACARTMKVIGLFLQAFIARIPG